MIEKIIDERPVLLVETATDTCFEKLRVFEKIKMKYEEYDASESDGDESSDISITPIIPPPRSFSPDIIEETKSIISI